MARFDGSLALKLEFGDTTTTFTPGTRRPLVAAPRAVPAGPDKYKVLERRRRRAQINARRLLDQM